MKTKHVIALAVALVATTAYAAYDPSVVSPETNIFSVDFASKLGGLMFWGALLGRAYSAIRNGGGLIGIWNGLVFGTNVPKVVATDYKAELAAEEKKDGAGAKALCFAVLMIGAGGFALTTFSGCQTINAWVNTTDADKIEKITSTVSGLSSSGVAAAIGKKPETRVYFQAAAEILEIAVGEGTTNPDAVRALLLKAFEGKADNHTDIVNSSLGVVLGLYQTFYGLNVSNAVDAKPAFRAVLAGLTQGIKAGANDAASSGKAYDLSLEDLKLSR
jgi:hypothetical protein